MVKRFLQEEVISRALAENIFQKIFLKNRESVYIFCNESYAKSLGVKAEEVKGKTDYDLFSKKLAKKLRSEEEKIIEKGKREVREKEQFQDGKRTFIRTVRVPIRNRQGHIVALLGIIDETILDKERQKEDGMSQEIIDAPLLNNPVIFYSFEFIGEIPQLTHVSKNIKEVLGFGPEKFINNFDFFRKCIHSEDFQKLINSLKKVRKEGKNNWEKYRFKDKQGNCHYLYDKQQLVINKDGNQRVMGVWCDLTGQKKARLRSEVSEKESSSIVDAIPDIIFRLDRNGEYIDIKVAEEDRLAFPRDELLKKNIKDVFSAEVSSLIIDAIKRAISTKKIQTISYSLKVPSGEKIFEARILRFNKDEVICFVRDVTEAKRIEEQLHREHRRLEYVLDSTGTGIDIIDANFNIRHVNESWQKVYGDPSGRKCYEYYMGRSKPCLKCGIPVALKTKKVVIRENRLLKEKNKVIEVRTIPFQNSSGEWLVAEVNIDITQRKKMEMRIKNAYENLKSTQDHLIRVEKLAALGKLAGIMAHDIRNPLAVIRNSTYLLKKRLEGSMDSYVKKYLKLLDEEISVADNIIEEVLGFTRVKSMKILSFDLNALLLDVLGKVSIPEFISIDKKIDKKEIRIKGDKEQLQRLFINLIRNGVEAMNTKGQLTIETAVEAKSAVAKISDTGVGIRKKDMDKLLEPMYSSKIQGTGLGLPACKNIIEAHKGHISIESELGRGSTFSVFLPL